jgi:hypothetical protein
MNSDVLDYSEIGTVVLSVILPFVTNSSGTQDPIKSVRSHTT